MEFKQAVGSRRSIRFWQPWRPIEQEKLQAILEAIYRAPRVLEVDFVRVVVMRLDQMSDEDLQAMKGPTTTTQLELCPIIIWVYADLDALEEATDGKILEELIEVGALNASHGWTNESISATVVPEVYRPIIDDEDSIALTFRTPDGIQTGESYSRQHFALARAAIGIAQEHGLLAAVDEGLGAQLSAVAPIVPKRIMGIPDSWITTSPILVGYAAEDLQAGGQRPREPLEEDFFEGRYGSGFHRDAAVVERLKEAGMIRPEVLAWRKAEVRRIARMFGLPE
jgi:nitroreductase